MIFTKKNMFFLLFIAVFVACCVFSNKVFAEENVAISTIEGASISTGNNTIISDDSNRKIAYFHSNSNYIYTITFQFSSSHSLWISQNEPTIGSQLTALVTLQPGETYTFVGNSDFYITNFTGNLNDRFTVTSRPVNQYDDTIDSLTQAISLDNLWAQFGVGLIALAVLFALGFIVVRKVLKKDSNYKG